MNPTDELAALYEASLQINSQPDMPGLLNAILLCASRLLGGGMCGMYMTRPDDQSLALTVAHRLSLDCFKAAWPVGDGVVGRAAQSGEVIAAVDDQGWDSAGNSAGIRRALAAPLKIAGNVIGVILLADNHPGEFTPNQIRLISLFADQAAIAIENARLNDSLRQQAAESAALYRASTSLLTPGGDLQSVCRQIVRTITQEFTTAHCGVLLADWEHQLLRVKAQSGYLSRDEPSLSLDGPGLTVAALLNSQPVYVKDVSQDSRFVRGALETRSELAIPLRVGDRLVGVLNLESPELDGFDERDQRVFSSYAERAALAIQNALLFESVEKHARQIALLGEITASALATSNLKELLPVVLAKLRQIFQANGTAIALWDERKCQVIPTGIQGDFEDRFSSLNFEPGEPSLTGLLLEEGRPKVMDNTPSSPYSRHKIMTAWPVKTVLGLPLIMEGQKLGAVFIIYSSFQHLNQAEVDFGEQVARQLALAIARIKSLEMAQRHAQEAENLRMANAALTSSLNLDEVLDSILDHLARVIPYDSACVFMVRGDHLHAQAARGFSQPVAGLDFPIGDELLMETARLGRPMILADVHRDSRFKHWGETEDVHGWMGVPLKGKGETIGFLTIDSFQVGAFDEEQAELALAFANQAAIAIENARLHAEVQELAITDPLTGLYNRRGFFELSQRELLRSRRSNTSLSAIMIDADNLKAINDRHGHDMGDLILRKIADQARLHVRKTDIICRYGGDEFAILLPESSLKRAEEIAERLRQTIAEVVFETAQGPVKISISLGVAALLSFDETLDELLKQADQALYLAKGSGRNSVGVWRDADPDI